MTRYRDYVVQKKSFVDLDKYDLQATDGCASGASQLGLFTRIDIGRGSIVGMYCGQLLSNELFNVQCYRSVGAHRWAEKLEHSINIGGPEMSGKADGNTSVGCLLDPYPRNGNEIMLIRDYRQSAGTGDDGSTGDHPDARRVNCKWINVTYRGWTYVLTVTSKKVPKGSELLIEYVRAWRLKQFGGRFPVCDMSEGLCLRYA